MAKTIQIKRGLEANRTGVTPAAGEFLWTTDQHELWVGDGSTAGGIKVTANVEGNYIPNSEKAAANGVATLDGNSKIPTSQLPALAITDTYTAADETAHKALVLEKGDVVVRTDENKSYIAIADQDGTATDLSGYQELLTPTDAVQSVNGQTGAVVLTTDDINEGSTNLYYTDARADARVLAAIDDTAGAGDTTKLWSADKITSEINGAVVTTFTGLSDTPGSYASGDAGKFVRVNSGETGLEFAVAGINDLSDVDTATNAPTNGQILNWNGTNWVPTDAPSGTTDISIARTANDVTVESSTGTDGTIAAADSTNAGVMTAADKTKLDGIAAGAEVNVQADWSETDTNSDAYIQNKPTDLTDLSQHNIGELSDVDTTSTAPSNGDLFSFDGTNWVPVASSTVGRTSFVALDDTPANYTGSGSYVVKVKSDESGLEFVDDSVIDGGTF